MYAAYISLDNQVNYMQIKYLKIQIHLLLLDANWDVMYIKSSSNIPVTVPSTTSCSEYILEYGDCDVWTFVFGWSCITTSLMDEMVFTGAVRESWLLEWFFPVLVSTALDLILIEGATDDVERVVFDVVFSRDTSGRPGRWTELIEAVVIGVVCWDTDDELPAPE